MSTYEITPVHLKNYEINGPKTLNFNQTVRLQWRFTAARVLVL